MAGVTAYLDTARRHTEYGYRKVAAALRWEHPDTRVPANGVYRVLRQHGLLGRPIARHTPSTRAWVRFQRSRPDDLWPVDVSYWYIEGWGFYYLHTVLMWSQPLRHHELTPPGSAPGISALKAEFYGAF